MSDVEHCLAILKALQISEVRYCLSGGGDSGTTELEHVLYRDGHHRPLPSVTIGIDSCGGTVCLGERLENIVADIPEATGSTTKAATATSLSAPTRPTRTSRSNAT
jgi:hypothetical protein